MSDLTVAERAVLEKLLGMGSGYVLNFSDRTFQGFVAESVGIDILADKYAVSGSSKAKRLRTFWRIEANHIVGKLLVDLQKYARNTSLGDVDDHLAEECAAISDRLLKDASSMEPEPLVFISYASPDLNKVEAVVALLKDAGLRTWFDKKDLKAGEDWELVIRERIAEAAVVLICLSTNAVDRKGYFHKEMRVAVEQAMKLPKGKVYIMPVRFDDCAIPDDLRHIHALVLYDRSASRKLLSSIGSAINRGVRAGPRLTKRLQLHSKPPLQSDRTCACTYRGLPYVSRCIVCQRVLRGLPLKK